MPYNPFQPFAPEPAAQAPKWAQALQILGATLKDTGGAVGGYQSNALGAYNEQTQQQARERAQQVAQQSLAGAFQDSARGGGMPDIKSLAPILMANPQFAGPVLEMLKMMQPEQGAGFTLGEGQTRYGANGQAIASAPRAAPQESPFNLSPGQVRYGADGKQIASLPTAPDAGTAAHQDAINLGLQQGTPQYNAYMRERTLPKPNQININQPPSGYVPAPTAADPFALRPVTGGPADPSRPKDPTIDQLRNQQLYLTSKTQLGVVEENFDTLANLGNQAGAKINPALPSAGYQRAKSGISEIIANFIYSVSGATANPGEVATRTEIAIPFPGEAAESVADKKNRVKAMVEGIRVRAEGGSMEQAQKSYDDAIKPKGKGADFKSADDVAAAYRSGALSRDAAAKILRDKGWAD